MSLSYRPKHVGPPRALIETEKDDKVSSKGFKIISRPPVFWFFCTLLCLFFLASIIYFWISQSEFVVARVLDDEGELNHLVDQFARTITRQDWQGNVELFVAGSTIDFHRAFTFLTDNPPFSFNNDLDVAVLPVGSWGQQLSVFAGGLSSNHLLIGNCNISFSVASSSQNAALDCIAIYSYTLAYSMSLFTNNYPTQFVVFQPSFRALKTTHNGWLFTHAVALVNATSTLLSSVETGVAPPGAITMRKRTQRSTHVRDPSIVWTTLQYQIDTLIAQGQIDTAKAVCRTEQYITLASTFDPYANGTSFQCNTIMRIPVTLSSTLTCDANGGINASSCFPDGVGGIETINSILPYPITDDFTITGGFGISIQGGVNGIIVHNVGLVSMMFDSSPELILTVTALPIPTLHITNAPQPPNTVWAGPLSGSPFAPAFRMLTLLDIPLIDLSSHVTNVLGLVNGGTNNSGPYVGDRIIVSNAAGTRLEESVPLLDGYFLVGGPGGSLIPGTIVAGDGINVTFNGGSGTFSITALDALTVVQVDLSVPTDIFQVTSIPIIDNGTLTFVAIPQVAHSIWMGPNGGGPMIPSFRVLQEVDLPTISLTGTKLSGILPVTRGGTNNDGSTWVGERLMMTNPGGASLTEGIISGINGVSVTLGPGPLVVVSGTGGTCVGNETIDQTCLDISNLSCPGGSLSATCIPSALTLSALTVTGPSSLGTSTTCAAPLSAPCYDISSQSCPGGYLNANCVNPDLTLNSLHINSIVVNDITLLNGTITVEGMSDFESVNTTTLYVQNIQLSGPMMCSPEDTISHDCYDISGISCTTPISSNCFPINITVADLSVTNQLEVVNVACLGPQLGDDCIPSRVRTINGISPSLAPALDFTIGAGTGILISNIVNGITIANTGVTSVGLSLPSSILSVTISSVTTTGTLTAVLQPQAERTFWAGPVDGLGSGDPAFRLIEFTDLPVIGTDSLYFVDSAGNLTTAPLSLSLVVPNGEFSISGSPITNPTGTFTISKQIQAPHSFWAGPSSGITSLVPSFRTMVFGDLASLGLTNGQILTGVTGGAPVGKTLVAGTNMIITEMGGSFVFDASNVDAIANLTLTVPSYLSVNPATLFASGTFDITANDQNANLILAGPTSGMAGPTSFRSMVNADLPSLTDGMIYIGQTGGAPVSSQLTSGALITITPGPGTSTISSSALGLVTLNMPTAVFDVSVVSGANSETITVTFDTQIANTVWAGPSTGIPALPTFRVLVAADIPSLDASKITSGILPIARGGTNSGTALVNNRIMISSGGAIVERAAMTNGQLLIGSTGLAPNAATLTGTTNRVTVTNGAGTITLSGPQNIHTAATPTFSSQTLSATTNQLTLGMTNTAIISATAPAASRTYTIADPGANANFVMDTAGPLVITSTPLVGQVLTATSGTTANWATPTTGTVTSVGLSLPASVFSISGSPVTGSGTLTGSFNTQTANTFFAGPSSGGAAVPTFRAITTADLPPAVLLTYVEQTNSTAESGFNSPTYTTVPGMSVSPVAGTYWCSFSTTVFPSSGSAMFNLGLFRNGVLIDHSRRIIGGAGSNFNIHTLAVGVISSGDTIDVRWQRTSVSGSATVYERSLYCLRIF